MKDLELRDFNLEVNAGNVNLNNLEVKNFDVEVKCRKYQRRC